MIASYLLRKDHLQPLLRQLKKKMRLIAPVKNRHGDTLYTEIEELVELDLGNQPQASLKPFLFPQEETLFHYRTSSGGEYEFTPALEPSRPTIFFGVRGCDLAAVLYMDVIFLQGQQDPYYRARRQHNLVVTIGCHQPFANCFCRFTRSGPFLEFGYDLQLTDLGDRYLVETGRHQGEELIAELGRFFTPATEVDNKAQYQLRLEALGHFKHQVPIDAAIERLRHSTVPETAFTLLAGRCQDCGGCAFVCPTCTCFTLSDHPDGGEGGERRRSWDACTFSGFTAMAGGHNPCLRERDTMRRRFTHKLLHDVNKHGRPSCTGCGRCIGICFGGVDILKFIALATAEELP